MSGNFERTRQRSFFLWRVYQSKVAMGIVIDFIDHHHSLTLSDFGKIS